MGQVIYFLESTALGVPVHTLEKLEINIVDTLAILVAVDQVQGRPAYTLDGGEAQFHWAGWDIDWLCASFQSKFISQVRIRHTKCHATGAGPMLLGKVGSITSRFSIDDEIDAALAV